MRGRHNDALYKRKRYLLAPCALWEPAPADCTPRQIVPLALGSVVAIWFVGFILSRGHEGTT